MIPSKVLAEMALLIFDLDGTLVDSEVDLAISVNAVLERMGRERLSTEQVASYVGQGVTVLVQRALGAGTTEEEVECGVAMFLEFYREHMLDHTVPYPGVKEALDNLGAMKMAVLTNKPVRFSRDMLAGLGLAPYFMQVYGGNSFENKKPDPVGIFKLMSEAGVPPARTLMIGDSIADILAGRNADVWTCGVSYGFGAPTLREVVPDLMIGDLRELPPLLNGKCVEKAE